MRIVLPPNKILAIHCSMWYNRNMEYIDLRKLSTEETKQIRRQVVRLKEMGKTGKEIEEIVGLRPSRISTIWTAYQRNGEVSFLREKSGRKPGSNMILSPEEQSEIREIIVETRPENHGLPGCLWTLKKVCALVQKRYGKDISDGCASDYMRRWGLTSQRPVKRARKQDPKRV